MGISWSKIWKSVSLTCTVIVAVAAVFGIWSYLIKPTAKLSAVVEYSDVYWPPTFVKHKLDELTELDNIRKAIIDPNLNHEDSEISSAFREYLKEGLSEFRGSLRKHSGLYRIQIANNGKRICNGVSVKLPYVCLVEVIREDNTREILENVSVITIGDLKPKEGVSLNAWSNYSSNYSMDEIRITHDFGVASIDIRKPVGYLGRWVDKYQLIILVVVVTLGLSFLAIVVEAKSEKDEGENGQPEDGKTVEEAE